MLKPNAPKQFPRCYSCGDRVMKLVHRFEGTTLYIDFVHMYGDCCTDIMPVEYISDPTNISYLNYISHMAEEIDKCSRMLE